MNLSRKSKFSILATLILSLGLLGGLYVSQQQQDNRSKAALGSPGSNLIGNNMEINGNLAGNLVGSNNDIDGFVGGCVKGDDNNIDGSVGGKVIGKNNDIDGSIGNAPCVGLPGEPTAIPTTQPTSAPTIILSPTPTRTPTSIPTNIPTPTPTRIPTVIPTQTPTPTTQPGVTKLSFNVLLHGIGSSGDNVNPTAAASSNKNPLHTTRIIKVFVYNSSNQLVASVSGNITYSSTSGNFTGSADLPSTFITGPYLVRVESPTRLRRLIPGIQNLVKGQINNLPPAILIAGDVNSDNILSIIDYNLIVGCYSDLTPAASCTTESKPLTDLNDDGKVNQIDYNLFLRELTVQNGD